VTEGRVDLSIVVVSYNVRAVLERTLTAALADSAPLDAEIIVVDNDSSDDSAAMVRTCFPTITIVHNRENRYYTAANNQGFAMSRGRYVLVLNPDAEIQSTTLPILLAALEERPDVGLASCRMLWPQGAVQHNCCAERSFWSLLLDNSLVGVVLRGQCERARAREWYAGWDRLSEREVGVLPGSFVLVRRSVLEHVGGFDERLRLYFAEDDWCGRVRRAGFGVRYLPIGAVVHPEGASIRQTPRLARSWYFEDLDHFVAGRFGRGKARLLKALAFPFRWGLDAAGWVRGERQ